MVFKTLNGHERDVPTKQYQIDWAPAREVSSWQAKTKAFLRPYWERDIVFEEFRIPGPGKLRIDLLNVNKAVVVEVSPESSHSFNKFFHQGSLNRFKNALMRDLKKAKWATDSGFDYVELTEADFPLTPEAFARQGVIL